MLPCKFAQICLSSEGKHWIMPLPSNWMLVRSEWRCRLCNCWVRSLIQSFLDLQGSLADSFWCRRIWSCVDSVGLWENGLRWITGEKSLQLRWQRLRKLHILNGLQHLDCRKRLRFRDVVDVEIKFMIGDYVSWSLLVASTLQPCLWYSVFKVILSCANSFAGFNLRKFVKL